MSKLTIVAGAMLIALLTPAAAQAAASTASAVHPKPAANAKPAPAVKVAPADEYFGRMKMSILGITNTIRDTGIREGFDPNNASKYYGGLALTENALEDWAHKYPQDSWIPRRAYDLSHDFWRMHTPQANAAAQRCRAIMFRQFPHNHWTVIARSETAAKVAPVAVAPVAASQPVHQQ
jgi:hypothetical protein